ncbi:agmatine/peptidylarginine deiminase [Flavihumibacter sp. ZG627]|uniref:agmatine deiminase family protein n=1 Tax=Flavihumibacter sp. ZG627 TaxID=1463156 RepID=UPI000693CA16|nr:agmatine deiminase family protein [Flavihumibacter sp. ZG627]
MNRTLFLFLTLALISCQPVKKEESSFFFPPEWEEQESVWLGWSIDSAIQQVHLQMAAALSPHVSLTILSRSDSVQQIALRQISSIGIDTTTVRKYIYYIPNIFIRDAGPRFLKNKKGELAIADFAWNNYGYPTAFEVNQYSDIRGEIDDSLAKQMQLPLISSSIVAEGGGLEVSSSAMICFEETALQRNPGSTLVQIEKEYLRIYGKQQMIWLGKMPLMDEVQAGAKAGNYFGYGANGHTDEFVRFVNDSTIVFAEIDSLEKDLDPVSNADYAILKENLALIKKAKDLNGKPFHIIKFPVPAYSLYVDKMILTDSLKNTGDGKILYKNFKEGDEVCWLPAVSYCNFLISNKTVLVAKYWRPGLPESEKRKDDTVKTMLQKIFADREIIQIDPMALNRYGGGMHCASQQEPAKNNR